MAQCLPPARTLDGIGLSIRISPRRSRTHLPQRILERLAVEGEASPTELAHMLKARVANVAYHVQVLLKLNCVELVRTRQRRGALEHYHRASTRPWLDPDRWAQLTASFRRRILARELQEIVSNASDAAVTCGCDHPDARVGRMGECRVLGEDGEWKVERPVSG